MFQLVMQLGKRKHIIVKNVPIFMRLFRFFRPRGLAGSLLIVKIAGELAEQGKTMNEIVDVCQKVRANLRTIGLSASGIRAPGQRQSFDVSF